MLSVFWPVILQAFCVCYVFYRIITYSSPLGIVGDLLLFLCMGIAFYLLPIMGLGQLLYGLFHYFRSRDRRYFF